MKILDERGIDREGVDEKRKIACAHYVKQKTAPGTRNTGGGHIGQ